MSNADKLKQTLDAARKLASETDKQLKSACADEGHQWNNPIGNGRSEPYTEYVWDDNQSYSFLSPGTPETRYRDVYRRECTRCGEGETCFDNYRWKLELVNTGRAKFVCDPKTGEVELVRIQAKPVASAPVPMLPTPVRAAPSMAPVIDIGRPHPDSIAAEHLEYIENDSYQCDDF